jgi:uncharacterized protein GlcG (DUF336 family)
MRLLVILLCLLGPHVALAAGGSPTVTLHSISPELATKAVVTAVADCAKRGFSVAAAVVGREGNLLAFLRSPLSGPHTILTSQQKAYTAATLRARTSQMQARPDLSFAPGILLIVGGVPISGAGKFYGGVAVAGADPAIDEKCAEAGLAAIQEMLDLD